MKKGSTKTQSRSQQQSIYKQSDITHLLKDWRQHKKEEPLALFTDIDKTFYRSGKEEAAREITRKAQHEKWPIIAITGNSYDRVLERIQKGELPYFQIIAGSVGTEIWVLHSEGQKQWYVKDTYFEKQLLKTGFVRPQLLPKAHAMVKALRQTHPHWHVEFQEPAKEQEMLKHPDPTYQPFKISFGFTSSPNRSALTKVSKTIAKFFPAYPIIICEDSGSGEHALEKKYCLDIVAGTKSGALKYIQNLFAINRGVVAGDSGNDVDMLLDSNTLRAVMVGGHELTARVTIEEAHRLSKRHLLNFFGLLRQKPKRVHIDKSTHLQAGESILKILAYFEHQSLWKQGSRLLQAVYQKLTLPGYRS